MAAEAVRRGEEQKKLGAVKGRRRRRRRADADDSGDAPGRVHEAARRGKPGAENR